MKIADEIDPPLPITGRAAGKRRPCPRHFSEANTSGGFKKVMKKSYEAWSIERLNTRAICAVETTMRCIPLREDPICRECFEAETLNAPGETNEKRP